MKFPIVLNKVDHCIKALLLNYPSLFSSRFDVLVHLFLTNGNGMSWDQEGNLVSQFDEKPLSESMQFEDIDSREQKNETHISICLETKSDVNLLPFLLCRRAYLKRLRMEREAIAADIDLYAKLHVMEEDTRFELSANWLNSVDPNWTTLALDNPINQFPNKIDKDWALAAKEITTIAIKALERELKINKADFQIDQADSVVYIKYTEFKEILYRLSFFTE